MDLSYKNKEGISLSDIFTTIKDNPEISKKDLSNKVNAKKSIDTLLKKLLDADFIIKSKKGKQVVFEAKVEKVVEEENLSKEDNTTEQIDEEALNLLKEELEKKTGKKVTAILHKKEKKERPKTKNPEEIYDEIQKNDETIIENNPYRFILNFFTDTLNGEYATTYFRRRDNYVVKSIYNKFKAHLEKLQDYNINGENLPFYRCITLDMDEQIVKLYHIDMNRVIRGSYKIFKLSKKDIEFIKERLAEDE